MWICQWIIMCGVLFWNTIKYTCQSWPTSCWAEWLYRPYGMICFKSLLIRQLYNFFATDFDRGVLQLVGNDITNILFKYWVSYRHWYSSFKHSSCWWKALQNFIHYSWIFNVQLYVHLKKWTLKFKLLYLLNHISYFNKICRICCLNIHVQSLKVRLKSILPWLKYRFFSRGLFFIGAPCIRWPLIKNIKDIKGGEKCKNFTIIPL